jgi:hydroxymethylpyrimidine pyrophosphatase-like HAD family hydrolase
MLAECQKQFHGQLTLTRSKPIYLEFLHPNVNKGEGFKALCRELSVPLEQTAAFGDAYNDLEMLQAAGTSFVVENALPEVKAIADHVIPSNNADGVALVMEKMIARSNTQSTPAVRAGNYCGSRAWTKRL